MTGAKRSIDLPVAYGSSLRSPEIDRESGFEPSLPTVGRNYQE
ncbi:hypothetical protein [Haladaptatus sp. CMAA 1911]